MKKTRKEVKDTRLDWYKWRWEFLRDNVNYQKAYTENILPLRKKYEHLVNGIPLELNGKTFITYDAYLQSEAGQTEKGFCKQFGLYSTCMIDPKKSFEDITEGPDCLEKACFFPVLFWEHYLKWDVNNGHLCVNINLEKINSFESLKVELTEVFKILFDSYLTPTIAKKHFAPGGKGARSSKEYGYIVDLGRFYNNLQAKSKTRIPYPEAAKQFYGKQYTNDPEGFRKRFERELKEYRRLTIKGYLEITYP
ncbi:hypothetical protein PITCH_A1150041 [uncultured Desulfobacterium sp.]|uniref:Uncharacterized protein n=1 Tax=uncultured Desulfobacterium sp. TaxID=201089 RepID=A0A445MRD9_9BACT|nr:hypothetical protein PITCH_A1150041 [uncultured Desulfobacterium sp.]